LHVEHAGGTALTLVVAAPSPPVRGR
jgi:hypothetical protein